MSDAAQAARRGVGVGKAAGRTRPTNNQLLYRATFQWGSHYPRKLQGSPQLPEATEACASVTSAFLQVIGVLFEVERIREEGARNILQALSTNTRRTKVVELSSGTHRVPEELKRHSITDGEGGHYSTNLDRNRYGSDDQYLATVVRYNLEFLDICPCLVNITILDAKAGDVTIAVSAGDQACSCRAQPDPSHHRTQKRLDRPERGGRLGQIESPGMAVKWEDEAAKDAAEELASEPAKADVGAPLASHHLDCLNAPQAPSKSNGSDLFDALLMAATGHGGKETGEPQVTSRRANGGAVPFLPRSARGLRSRSSGQLDEDFRMDTSSPLVKEASGSGLRMEPLRRSRRKSVKVFRASMLEGEGSGDSDGPLSTHSVEGDTEAADQAVEDAQEDMDREGAWKQLQGRRSRMLGGAMRGASAANLSKLAPGTHEATEHQHLRGELAQARGQLEATDVMLGEARAQQAQANARANQLALELASQHALTQKHLDQIAHLRAEVQLLASAKAEAKPLATVPEVVTASGLPEHQRALSMLKDAEQTVARLEKENAALATALSAVNTPGSSIRSGLVTPHRNGEGVNGIPGHGSAKLASRVLGGQSFHSQAPSGALAQRSYPSLPDSIRAGTNTPSYRGEQRNGVSTPWPATMDVQEGALRLPKRGFEETSQAPSSPGKPSPIHTDNKRKADRKELPTAAPRAVESLQRE